MSSELIPAQAPRPLTHLGSGTVPALFASAGDKGRQRFLEFFAAEIRNSNTRAAYATAIRRFDDWCRNKGFRLEDLTPVHVAAYVEQLGRERSKPTVKQHLAALRMLFDYLVTGQVVPHNPAHAVRGPKHVVRKGKTPVLDENEAKDLFAAIAKQLEAKQQAGQPVLAELRDRALIGVMVYSFARVSAVVGMNVEDYYQQGKRCWLRLHEKGGKHHEVPAHHKVIEFLDAYVAAAGIEADSKGPLFRTLDRHGHLTATRLNRHKALRLVKRRSRAAGLGDRICNHSFRATGITNYLENNGTLEKAQAIACHESPRTTKLYDRTNDQITLDEIERIVI